MKRDFQRGSVSIFLVIILVPCIVVSSIFVDLSRVKLSQGVATSSADLALNSLMSYYDKDLSEIYGMMASCQNIEEFYEESAQFFLDALYSQGLGQDDIDSLVAMYSSVVGDDTVYDLLQLEVKTETKDIVSEVDGASLGESSLLIKDQVVDFMKYRGPIEITKGIVDRLKKNDVASQLTEASKNEPLVEDKQEYAEATGDLLEACFKSYVYLEKYVALNPTLTELRNIANQLKEYRELYREVNEAIVINFSNTSGLTQFSRPTYQLNTYSNTYKKTSSSVYSRKEEIDDVEHYYVDGEDIRSDDGKEGIIPEMQKKITAFENAKTNLVNAASTWINTTTGTGSNQTNEIQWWIKVNAAINQGSDSHVAKYKKAAEEMLKTYAKMTAMLECEDGEAVPEKWREDCATLQTRVSSLRNTYLKAGVTNGSDSYLKLVGRLETISANNIGKINPSIYKLSNGKTVGTTVSEIKTSLTSYKEKLQGYITALSIVIDGAAPIGVKSLDKIKTLVQTYENAFEAWEGTANQTDTSMGQEDRDEIAVERTKYDDITVPKVTELKTRLVNIRTQFQEVIDAIDAMQYGSKKLTNIGSYNNSYDAVKGKIDKNRLGMTNGELESYAKEVFESAFKPHSSDSSAAVLTLTHAEDATYNPDLTVSKPALYKYWEEKFGDSDVLNEKLKDAESEVEGGENQAQNQEDSIKNANRSGDVSTTNIYGNDSYTASEFPSGLDAASRFGLGTSILQSITGVVESITSGTYTNIRDSLYTTEYVMDMFSYATYVNEGKYHLYEADIERGEKQGPIKESDSPFSDYDDEWASTALTDTYNKTLTNQMINAENNIAHGAEAEYILYGKTNKENVTSAYVDIYSIRYPLNLVSGFQNFWSRTSTNPTARTVNSIADTIAASTSGIIPAIVTKTVLIALITVFETGRDLDRLQKGLPVEIYKKEEDWRLTLDGWATTDSTETQESSKGLFYSDYIYLFLYLGFESESASEMYLRVGDVVQVNMRKKTGSAEYTLKNAKTYFELNATIRVKPLMLTLPYATQYSNNPKDKADWCTFEISETRGYS